MGLGAHHPVSAGCGQIFGERSGLVLIPRAGMTLGATIKSTASPHRQLRHSYIALSAVGC